MERTIDCMGMACPLPVINAKKALEAFTENGTLHIKVDNAAHKEGNPEKIILNGAERPAGLISENELKAENEITVIM